MNNANYFYKKIETIKMYNIIYYLTVIVKFFFKGCYRIIDLILMNSHLILFLWFCDSKIFVKTIPYYSMCDEFKIDIRTGVIALLMETLLASDKQVQSLLVPNQKKHVKSISLLVSKAPICAARILQYLLSCPCFNLYD